MLRCLSLRRSRYWRRRSRSSAWPCAAGAARRHPPSFPLARPEIAARLWRAALVLALALVLLPAAARAALDTDTYRDDLSEAIRLESAGDLRGALDRLHEGVALYPRNWNLRVELARVYLALGNSPAAEIEAQQRPARSAPSTTR